MFLSELLSVVIFNHGAESQRDKCVSDYVVNYEMEILRISLNFSTKVSLFSTWQRTDPSIFLLNSHTLFTFFFLPTLCFQTLWLSVCVAVRWMRLRCCMCGFLGGYSTDYWPGIDLPLNALLDNWESLASSFSNKIACGLRMVWWKKKKKKASLTLANGFQ